MEHNEFSSDASTQAQTGAGAGNSSQDFSASTASTASSASSANTAGAAPGQSESQGITDRARDIAGTAKDKLADVGSSARERAGHLKNSLADALETGADRLRQRGGQSGQLGAATGTGSVALESDGRATQVTTRLAGGMSATADWLRDADLDGLRTGIERQVKEHPGRTLLIAVGMGYLIGKAFRK